MSKKKGNGKKKDAAKSYSGIHAHRREKKVLLPPLMRVPGISLQSWTNDRLPEMLWSAILISQLGRDRALVKFREAAAIVLKLPKTKRKVQPTLTGLASLESVDLQRFLNTICADAETKNALRPLLLLDNLPGRQEWAKAIEQTAAAGDWDSLKSAVLLVLNHQSQEATDCRWLRVLFQVLSGALNLQTKEQVKEILDYPNFGMPQKVRPTVRCMEGLIDTMFEQTADWPKLFWDQCLRDTPCDPRHTMESERSPSITTTRVKIREVRETLARHEKSCLKTTEIDARHDTTFGFAGYSLAILDELLSMSNSTSILGRIGLRTLLESYVTISYLKMRDDPNLWMAYRQYGSGQAKLAFLKLDDATEKVPSSVDVGVLSQLANEDRWLEFVPIDLGHWAARDLRRLSEEAGVKPDYDRLYSWTSAFTHGNWAAVRNSCFDLCANPLHRLHRRLRSDTADLGDIVADACDLVDKILAVVDSLYPGFTSRVTLPESRSGTSVAGAPSVLQTGTKLASLATVQREYFGILDEFFRRATGCSAEEFAPLDSFDEKISAEAKDLGPRAAQAFLYAHEALGVFYERFSAYVFSEAKNLPGLKLVLGGTSHLGKSQLESVRKMLLYADSILIPDPILPWVESPRFEERFRNVSLLEAAFNLLHFKPLVDADLPSVPLVVFPSFEKTLEERDPTTQGRIAFLISRVLSHFLDRSFDNLKELKQFATANEAEFLQAIDQQNLFVAPGGHVGQPLQEALELYETEVKRWRSRSYQATMKDMPKGLVALIGQIERLTPQYHLLENAEELSACPLVPLSSQWHYYSLISKFFAAQVQAQGILDSQTISAMDSMSEAPRAWLGNISITELVDLLSNRENEAFRARLRELAYQLRGASVTDLNRVVPIVCQGISALLEAHHSQIKVIQERYKSRYGDQRVRQYTTTGASFMATLVPSLRDPRQTTVGHQQPGGQSQSPANGGEPGNSLLGVLAVADSS
jgi:hypothetical protein